MTGRTGQDRTDGQMEITKVCMIVEAKKINIELVQLHISYLHTCSYLCTLEQISSGSHVVCRGSSSSKFTAVL
jgi:hypothetical protein